MSIAVQATTNANIDAIFNALKNTSLRGESGGVKTSEQAASNQYSDKAVSYDDARVEKHLSLMNKLQEAILGTKEGVTEIVDADSARLQALNVKQQLSAQTVSIANQSSDSVLSLFQ